MLHHLAVGSGRPLLTFHGAPGFDHTLLRPWLDGLASDATVVYFDHRGHGRSPRPADWSSLTLECLVGDAERLRAQLGLAEVVLFGHSLGCGLALEYALAHPGRVDGVVLCAGAPAYDEGMAPLARAQAKGTPSQLAALGAALGGPISDDATLERLAPGLADLYFGEERPGLAERLLAETRWSAAAWNQLQAHVVPALDLVGRLHAVEAPCLLISGAKDWFSPPAQSDRMARELPHAESVVFEGSGHFPFAEEPERFLAVVRQWLQRLPALDVGAA